MSELLLDSLEIKGYRCFEHLTIEKLGRVNLIVGKNNVGKTALLEALWIWAKCSNWNQVHSVLHEVLHKRKEINIEKNKNYHHSINSSDYRHLFYGRPKNLNGEDFDKLILIGEAGVVSEAYEFNAGRTYTSKTDGIKDLFAHYLKYKVSPDKKFPFGVHYYSLFNSIDIEQPAHLSGVNDRFHKKIQVTLVPANGLDEEYLVQNWDEIVWRNKEFEIIELLKILSDNIVNLNFTAYPRDSKDRIPVIHLQGVNEKVPLESLGEGMNRLLGLILALVESQNGILMVDEIETGFHYSALPNVWQMIFKTARDLNVQVFATTHSWDCIEAFTEAAIEDKESEGMLIRLENKNDKIKATTFSEKELEAVTRRNIEVR